MSQDTNKMSGLVKILIVLVLAVAVGAVIVVKQRQQIETVPAASVSAVTETEQEAKEPEVAPAPLPKLVDLGADKCIPCKKMAPILESLKEAYKGQFDVEFIDVWKNPDASKKYGIKLIPTQIFFDANGKELFRHEGFYSREDILDKWKEFGITLKNPSETNEEASEEPS